MKIQQIRNATLKIIYGGITFLVDPWLQDKSTGFSAKTVSKEMDGVKNPMDDLPLSPKDIMNGVDYCLVTHIHPDHFSKDYLPSDTKLIVQNSSDMKKMKANGFNNVITFEKEQLEINGITIVKAPAVHGSNKLTSAMMGKVSGYLLRGEEKQLYIAGDTVFYDGVKKTLNKFSPEVIALNCCEATLPIGRLIMDLNDLETVCKLCPKAAIIATHLDSVNHALINSDDVRRFVCEKNLTQVAVPHKGEWIIQ